MCWSNFKSARRQSSGRLEREAAELQTDGWSKVCWTRGYVTGVLQVCLLNVTLGQAGPIMRERASGGAIMYKDVVRAMCRYSSNEQLHRLGLCRGKSYVDGRIDVSWIHA
jgi:hypothetical protein